MPGPVSDSYDLEFGTSENATHVRDAIVEVIDDVNIVLDQTARKDIVEVVKGKDGRSITATLNEREWRIIRFCLHRAQESI